MLQEDDSADSLAPSTADERSSTSRSTASIPDRFGPSRAFRYGDSECNGDILLRSVDGVHFCVLSCLMWNASLVLKLLISSHSTVDRLPNIPLPVFAMSEDAETLAVVISTLYPGTPPLITSVLLASSCLRAAQKYQLRPSLFRFSRAIFCEESLRTDAFIPCVLAWHSGQWRFVQLASRYLNGADLLSVFPRAMTISGGTEVLAGLLNTQLERRRRMAEVVERLPTGLLCEACRLVGRRPYSAMMNVVERIFAQPYPDTSSIYLNPGTLATDEVLEGCASHDCYATFHQFAFSRQQAAVLEEAMGRVPRVMVEDMIGMKEDMEMAVTQPRL